MTPTVKLPKIVVDGDEAVTAALAEWRNALQWAVGLKAAPPLKLSTTPQGAVLSFEQQRPVQPFRLTASLASGTASSPTSATANPVYWTGSAYAADSTVTVTVRNRYTLSSTLASGSDVDCYFFMSEWHLPPQGGGGTTDTSLAISGSGGIPARSGTTPGSGSVTLVSFNGTTLTTGSTTVTAYNLSTTAVGATKYLQILQIGGYWFANWEDC